MKKWSLIISISCCLILSACSSPSSNQTRQSSIESSSSTQVQKSSSQASKPSSKSSSSSTKTETRSSSSSSEYYPEGLYVFTSGELKAFAGTYVSPVGTYIVISDKIYYYNAQQKLVGQVITNHETYLTETLSPTISQTYTFNKGQIKFLFGDHAYSMSSIQIMNDPDNQGKTTDFKPGKIPVKPVFSSDNAIAILKKVSKISGNDYAYVPTKYGEGYIIKVVSKSIAAGGGTGTVGLYEVLPDGSAFLVTYNPDNGKYIREK
ncbi:hypothetical protein [Lactococcus fujiensis]|uniref:hypothetical protein n=1 Tax=Lactococcus fujiensis TaxID=610251 RepID=UPI00117BBDC2|nr:hypothetical protein [Lactococcus fujiensis]